MQIVYRNSISLETNTLYHCDKTEELKLLAHFQDEVSWLYENIQQQGTPVLFSEQGSDILQKSSVL
jgi:hypothetical protein